MIKEAIKELAAGKDLSSLTMEGSMEEIMNGQATPAQIGAFLAFLKVKGETVDEITQAAKVMRKKSLKVEVPMRMNIPLLDTCSTGGTGINHFNISTASAFVAAGMEVKVAKHGNRAVSGKCGSADVLEKLGVKVELEPDLVKRCMEEAGICFMFAPVFHGAMKHAAAPRREIGIRTIFNILGPLTNPASATHQILGVYDAGLTELLAKVLGNLKVKRAMVVHGTGGRSTAGGIDEVSLAGTTKVAELKDGTVKTYEIEPEDFGLSRCGIDDIKGGDAEDNARIMMEVLNGKESPYRQIVLASSAAAFVIMDMADNLKDGVKLAAESLDSKKALDKLKKLIEISNK